MCRDRVKRNTFCRLYRLKNKLGKWPQKWHTQVCFSLFPLIIQSVCFLLWSLSCWLLTLSFLLPSTNLSATDSSLTSSPILSPNILMSTRSKLLEANRAFQLLLKYATKKLEREQGSEVKITESQKELHLIGFQGWSLGPWLLTRKFVSHMPWVLDTNAGCYLERTLPQSSLVSDSSEFFYDRWVGRSPTMH